MIVLPSWNLSFWPPLFYRYLFSYFLPHAQLISYRVWSLSYEYHYHGGSDWYANWQSMLSRKKSTTIAIFCTIIIFLLFVLNFLSSLVLIMSFTSIKWQQLCLFTQIICFFITKRSHVSIFGVILGNALSRNTIYR